MEPSFSSFRSKTVGFDTFFFFLSYYVLHQLTYFTTLALHFSHLSFHGIVSSLEIFFGSFQIQSLLGTLWESEKWELLPVNLIFVLNIGVVNLSLAIVYIEDNFTIIVNIENSLSNSFELRFFFPLVKQYNFTKTSKLQTEQLIQSFTARKHLNKGAFINS